MTAIGIVAFDDVTDIDVFLHWDFLNRPRTMFADGGLHQDWSVQILGTKDRHMTKAGLEFPVHGRIEQARNMDAIVVASGPPTRDLMSDESYLERLALDPSRQYVCSQCSGALILGGSGLLKGLRATTYPTARAELESTGALFTGEPLVTHERMAMAAGCLAGVELDRWLLANLLDAVTADKCIDSGAAWGSGIEKVYA